MDASKTQALFFEHIKSKLPAHLSVVDEIAELLDISNDSAYRRIRGIKPLGLDEIQILCNQYNVSLDQLLGINTNTAIFSYDKVDHIIFDFNRFLQSVAYNLELFSKLQNPHVYYYSKDLPIFHFMPFPELRAFKFFFWKRTLIGYPELARQQFNGEEPDAATVDLAKKINELYVKVPFTDIFNEESINATISQIELYRQSNIFASKEVLLKVYAQLEELVNHLEQQAEAGRKSPHDQYDIRYDVPYEVYINETLIGDNTIFVQSDNMQIAFINHIGLNFMSTQDKSFCEYTYKNIQHVLRKSSHISVVGEKERSMFFNVLREKIQDRVRNIK